MDRRSFLKASTVAAAGGGMACAASGGSAAVELDAADRYTAAATAGAAPGQRWTLLKRSLTILRRTA